MTTRQPDRSPGANGDRVLGGTVPSSQDGHARAPAITVHDLDSPNYVTQDFRLPEVLLGRVTSRYVLGAKVPGLYLYAPRDGGRPPPGPSSP